MGSKKVIKTRTNDDIVDEASKGPAGRSTKKGEMKKAWSLGTIFKHADGVDLLLMAMGFLGAVGDGLCTPVMLLIMSKLMNNLGQGPSKDSSFLYHINQNALGFLYLACCSWVVSFLEGYCWTRTGERQAARTRTRYLKAVLRQDVGYFDMQGGADTSEVVVSVSTDTIMIQDALGEKVPNLIMNSASLVGSYCVAFTLEWRLAVVAFPFAVLLIIPGLMYGRMLMSLARKTRLEYNKAGAVAEQAISSIRTVYSCVAETKIMSEFSAALHGMVMLGLRQGLAKGLAIGSNGVTFAIWAFMAWYGSRLVMYHGGQPGSVFAAGASITLGGLSLGSGLSNLKYLAEACSAGERIMEVINRVPTIDSDDMNGDMIQEVAGEVEFRNVNFFYPSRPDHQVFSDFNLHVPAGKTVALVGKSGSGKSTAIALLERFYDPTGGEVLLDGVDVKKLQLKWLRAQMGLVSQEPALFAATIKENILFGKEEAGMDEVVAAAEAANAHHFITQLPQGYDTQVGERGVQISGGQKQRIAIARALIKSPKILLLDEATSALDSESERTVQEALHEAAAGRTTIIVAHRLCTIRHADIIAVVHNGQIAESGSHDHLLHHPHGFYSTSLAAGLPSDDHRHTTTSDHDINRNATNISTSPKYADKDYALHSTSISNKITQTYNDEEENNQQASTVSFLRLLSLNSPEWKHTSAGCVAATAFGAVQPVYAYMLASMVSVYFLTDHDEMKMKIRMYAIVLFFLFLTSLAFNVVQHYNFGAMGEYLTKRVRERMLSKMLTFEVGWFDRTENSTGALCSRLAKDANVVRSLVGDRMGLLVQTFSAVAIACTMGLFIAWRLALVMIAVQPLIIICYYGRKVLLSTLSTKSVQAQEESSKLAAEAVSHLRTVTAFSSQSRILRMFDAAQDLPRRQNARQSWLAGVGLGSSQFFSTCSWALDFWYGGKLVAGGIITAQAMLQTFMILVSTGRVIADAGSMTSDLAKGSDSIRTVFAVLDRITRIHPDDPDGHRPETIVGQIEFVDVDFAYPARPRSMILERLSLKIEAGKSLAVVGPSGSGKSTVIGLIERFYDPIRGTVKIDGIELRSYNLRSLRKHIALVGQEPVLFGGTIRDNIAYRSGHASNEITESEIIEAAKAAGAHEFIAGLKKGYAAWCGDGGALLSGGQKQRIAIARAILRNPAILLLDEATSALDSQSEQMVQAALERVWAGRTTVVVAHRLSTVKECDVIVVLQNGAVVEKGTHTSLIGKGPSGAYVSLVALQQQHNSELSKNA